MGKIGHNNPPIDVPEHITEPIEYLRYLVRYTDISTVAKAVGHELCCCMNEDGFCAPSGKDLMANTGVKDKRTMTEALRIIEREIGIMVERKRGARSQFVAPKVGALNVATSNVPTQKVGASNVPTSPKVGASNVPSGKGKGGTIGGDGERHSLATNSSTKKQPHQNIFDQIKKSDRENDLKKTRWSRQKIDSLFDEFWSHVPAGRKIGKPKCREIFEKLIKGKKPGFDAVEPQTIIAGMEAFNEAAQKEKTETQFIPHPTTWLNAGRWLDETGGMDGKPWGWWRDRGVDVYRQLGTDWWRDKVRSARPNGVWPWQELGPPPGHPECLLPIEAARNYSGKYEDQVKELLQQHGGKND